MWTSPLPTLLLWVVSQADGGGWPAIAVDEAIADRCGNMARPGTRGTSGVGVGVGTSGSAMLCAIFSDPDQSCLEHRH
jgi:hypothetical protein